MKQSRAPRIEAQRIAANQGGVISRRQLRALGLDRFAVANDRDAQRWLVDGRAVLVTGAEPARAGRWWAALANASPSVVLDGVTALEAGGLRGFTEDEVHLSAPNGARARAAIGTRLHVLRSFDPDDVTGWKGLRRTRPAIAAVRSALWLPTERQAQTVLVMTVQQRLATGTELQQAALRLPKNKRRQLVTQLAGEIAAGAMSVPELDFSRLCRRFGLPEPTRQQVRRRPNGTAYLDVVWAEYGVVVEIDGIQHGWAENVVADLLRHNDIALTGAMVLRIPALALRSDPAPFMAQVRQGLISRGWRP